MSDVVLMHERALLGAIDSYLSQLTHVRPFLVASYRDVLEAMAAQWLEEGGDNQIAALAPSWLHRYSEEAAFEVESRLCREAIGDFLAWAGKEGLTTLKI